MLIVFDLDGTLSDARHREHYVRRPVGEKDWPRFNEAASRDSPKLGILRTYLALEATGHEVEIWTGRHEEYRDLTLKWLSENGIHGPTLKMRPDGDYTLDSNLKSQWIDETDRHVAMAFEDRSSVVQMWRDRGITCCQVAEGDF